MDNNNYVEITKVICDDFLDIDKTVCVGEEVSYLHIITLVTNVTDMTNVEVTLNIAKNSFKYSQEVLSSSPTSITFITEPRTHELALFDELEVSFETNGETVSGKIPVTRLEINRRNFPLEYTTGYLSLPYSNMLYPRIKLGFPRWGGIEKNDISNGTKLLEPLFKPFYDSYHKVINFKINSLYKKPYNDYQTVFLGSQPVSVTKLTDTSQIKMYETSAIQAIPKVTEIIPTTDEIKLTKIIMSPESTNFYNYEDLTNKFIYIKKLKWVSGSINWVSIKGYDKHGDIIQERVELVDDFFVSSKTKFSVITDIQCDTNIIISNYLDCSYDHILVKDPRTAAPIVDKDMFAFFPKIVKAQNNEETRDVLHLYNISKEYSEVSYKFDIEQEGRLTSLYVDEHLRVYWTDGTKLYSGVLNHDLTKDVGRSASNNNNDVVIMNDTNTCIGDWADVSIDTDAWASNTPMVIQVKNNDSTLYYDQETEGFVEDIRYFYPKEEERFIEISVKVENDSAYIFTVFNDTLDKQYVASTHSNLIKTMKQGVECTDKLLLIDDKLVLGADLPTLVTDDNSVSDRLTFSLIPQRINSFDWELRVGGYSLTKTDGTLPEEFYKVLSGDGECNTPVEFELDRYNLLKHFQVDSLTAYLIINVDTLYNPNSGNTFNILCNDNYLKLEKAYTLTNNTVTIPVRFTRNTKELQNAV